MTEQELIDRAKSSLTACNWQLGLCAHLWTEKYASGRTDVDFANLLDTLPGYVGRCRRVWAEFGHEGGLEEVRARWPKLSWSHFDKARAFGERAREALDWAEETDATIRTMQAWAWSTWPELKTAATEPEAFEEDSVESDEPPGIRDDQQRSREAVTMDDEPTAEREPAPPEPVRSSASVRTVLRAFERSCDALRSGIFQQAEADEQSRVMELLEGLRSWLQLADNHGPSGDVLLLTPRLQWCGQVCTRQVFLGFAESTRTLIESAVNDLLQVVRAKR